MGMRTGRCRTEWFPRAEESARSSIPFPCGICEIPSPSPAIFGERHLQCIWADDRLRPPQLRTSSGETLEVEFAGEWNRGPGPDFLGAVLRVGDGSRRISGDVEIHVHPQDWRRHRHTEDPRYARVCAHISYYTGVLPAAELPPGALQAALRPALDRMDGFSFDNIDLMAYPIAARATPPPCRAAMRSQTPNQRGAALDAAGETRLARRTAWLRISMEDRGFAQVIYEETMAALGFRPNKILFRRLARILPLERLREQSTGNVRRAYALLAGTAGLLPDPTAHPNQSAAMDRETKTFIRTCWDEWWRMAGDCSGGAFLPTDWTRVGIRPANRPERRLMAAACLFAPTPGLPEHLEKLAHNTHGGNASRLLHLLETPRAEYWPMRLAYTSAPLATPIALIGASRARALVINLILPALVAMGAPASAWPHLTETLPAESLNEVVHAMADRLFGPDHAPKLYASALRRQGLIHLHHEYCLGDRSQCAACPLPDLLRNAHP